MGFGRLRYAAAVALSIVILVMAGCASAEVKATRRGDIDALREFIAKGGDVNAPQRGGASLLMIASSAGQVESAKLLLDSGARVDMRDGQGRTALMYAASAGQVVMVQLLLDSGAVVDDRDNAGATALILASGVGQLPVVQVLIERGATVDIVANGGWTALLAALDRSAQSAGPVNAVARLLLDRGASFDPASPATAQVAFRAAGTGNVDVLSVLFDGGLDPAVRDSGGNSLLMAGAGSDRVVALLLDRGAPVNDRNAAGETPLMGASAKGSLASVRLLLARGADPNLTASNGETALLLAAAKRNPELLRLLLLAGANPRAMDRAGNSPLHLAARDSDVESVRLLLTAGSPVNAANDAGESAYVLAGHNRDADAVRKVLLAAGAIPPAPPAPVAQPREPQPRERQAPQREPAGRPQPLAPAASPPPAVAAAPRAATPPAVAAAPVPAPAPGAAATPPGSGGRPETAGAGPAPSRQPQVLVVDARGAAVEAAVSWPAIRPADVAGWNASDPLRREATIRMRVHGETAWFVTDTVAVPVRQSGLDPFSQAYELRVDPSRLIECQVAIPTASGKSVNATMVARPAGGSLAFDFADFRLSASPDVAWPRAGTPVTAAVRYMLPAIPAAVRGQLQAAGDAIEGKKQKVGADRVDGTVTLLDSAGKELGSQSVSIDPASASEGSLSRTYSVAEGSSVSCRFVIITAEGHRLTAEGSGTVMTAYSHGTKKRPAAEAVVALDAGAWGYQGSAAPAGAEKQAGKSAAAKDAGGEAGKGGGAKDNGKKER